MPIPTGPARAPRGPLRDVVYATLLDEIVTGVLPPGSDLSDEQVAQRLGVSRTPVREALDRLAAIDLVRVAPRRWTQVAPLDVRDAHDALDVSTTLLGHVLRGVSARLTPEDREVLQAYLDDGLRDAGTYAAALRQREPERTVLPVVLERHGNVAVARAHGILMPTVRRYLIQRHDTLDLDTALPPLRQSLRGAIDGDGRAARDGIVGWARALVPEAYAPRPVTADAETERPQPTLAGEPATGDRTTTLAARTAADLRAAILDGTLEPGEVLREQPLMEWLGVSRTPLRVALTQLEFSGLVELTHHRLTRVSGLDERLAADRAELMWLLHRRAVDLAVPRLSPVRLSRLDAAVRVMDSAVDAGDLRTAAAYAVHWTGLLDDASGNRVLVRLTDLVRPTVQRHIAMAWDAARWRTMVAVLAAATRALADGDGPRARAALDEMHLVPPYPDGPAD